MADPTEKILILYSQDPRIPNEVRNEAGQFATDFQNSPEGLQWAISEYPSQTNFQLIMFSLNIFRAACRVRFANLPGEILRSLQVILFDPKVQQAQRNNIIFVKSLADAQVAFMWNSYPQFWPNFWEQEIQNPEQDILYFLEALCDYASFLTGEDNNIYNRIKNQMRQTGTEQIVANFLINKMSTGDKVAFHCFAHFCKWININYLMNPNGLNSFLNGFNHLELIKDSLDIFNSLASRGMPIENKQQLLSSINLPAIVNAINERYDISDSLLFSLSNAINTAGLEIIQTPLFDSYLWLALNFFGYESNDVSEAVTPFILEAIKTYPKYDQVILDSALNRFELYFQKLPKNEVIKVIDYGEKLTMILHSTMMTNIKVTSTSLSQIAVQNDFYSNMPRAAAIIHTIFNVMITKDPFVKEIIGTFINGFYPILKISPNSIEALHLFCITDIISLFVAVNESFNEQQITQIFSDLNTILVGSENPLVKESISESIVLFVKKLSKRITFEPVHIYNFIQTCNQSLVSAAAILISSLNNENKTQIFIESFQYLNKFLSENGNQYQSFIVILSFIKFLKFEENAPYINVIAKYLQDMFNICINEDELFSLYIHSSFSSLSYLSIPIIANAIASISNIGVKSITAISEALFALIDPQRDNTWISQCLELLMNVNISTFNNVGELLYMSDEHQEIMEMIYKFLQFCAKLLNISPQCFNQQTINVLIAFIKDIFERRFDIPKLMQYAVNIVTSIAKIDINIATMLSPLMLNFFNTNKFDPNSNDWFKICEKIMNFHLKLLQINEENAKQLICATLQQFGATQQMLNDYFMVLMNQRPRDRKAQGRQYFLNFIKLRKNIGL